MKFAARGRGESGVDGANFSVASQKEGGWPGVEVLGLRDLCLQLLPFPRDEAGVINAVFFDERGQARELFQLLRVFEIEHHNFESELAVFPIKSFKIRRFVVAVRAPTTANIY